MNIKECPIVLTDEQAMAELGLNASQYDLLSEDLRLCVRAKIPYDKRLSFYKDSVWISFRTKETCACVKINGLDKVFVNSGDILSFRYNDGHVPLPPPLVRSLLCRG